MTNNLWLLRFFPFLAWFPINSIILRGDLIAGITGGLVLVPKAMALRSIVWPTAVFRPVYGVCAGMQDKP